MEEVYSWVKFSGDKKKKKTSMGGSHSMQPSTYLTAQILHRQEWKYMCIKEYKCVDMQEYLYVSTHTQMHRREKYERKHMYKCQADAHTVQSFKTPFLYTHMQKCLFVHAPSLCIQHSTQ